MRTYQTSTQPSQQQLRGSLAHAHTSVAVAPATSESWSAQSATMIEVAAGVRHFDGKPEANLDLSPPRGWGSLSRT